MKDISIAFFVFDDLNRFLDGFVLNTNVACQVKRIEFCEFKQNPHKKKFVAVLRVDGYCLSVFSRMIEISELYSRMIAMNLLKSLKYVPANGDINIKLQLVKPRVDVLDYAWSRRLSRLIFQRQELENAMSWLSTLGGAFSALGDKFENYAKVAGKISVQQFKIAFQLGEPPLVARCRLYIALSLIQLGRLSTAKKVVENQYELSKSFKDNRLQNMCRGVWAKLQYAYKEKKINSNKT